MFHVEHHFELEIEVDGTMKDEALEKLLLDMEAREKRQRKELEETQAKIASLKAVLNPPKK